MLVLLVELKSEVFYVGHHFIWRLPCADYFHAQDVFIHGEGDGRPRGLSAVG